MPTRAELHDLFLAHLEAVAPRCDELLLCEVIRLPARGRALPNAGVYLFSEAGERLYVGRSDRLRDRVLEHGRRSSDHHTAPFAFKLAREATGRTERAYRLPRNADDLLPRAHLQADPAFGAEFLRQKERVRNMDLQVVAEPDPLRQALLEMYCIFCLGTRYNDFGNSCGAD